MALAAFGTKVYEDDFLLVYRYGRFRDEPPHGAVTISKVDSGDWRTFPAMPDGNSKDMFAEHVLMKLLRRRREQGSDFWPNEVDFFS